MSRRVMRGYGQTKPKLVGGRLSPTNIRSITTISMTTATMRKTASHTLLFKQMIL